MMKGMPLLSLIVLLALYGAAQAQTQPPSFFIVLPGGSFANPTKLFLQPGQTYSAAIGSNVTLGCQYTDASWRTTIGKWSVSPLNAALFPMYENGYASNAFDDIGTRYPAINLRVKGGGYYSSTGAVPTIVYMFLTNILQFDAGSYGCFSNSGSSKVTPTANITITINSTDLYGVRMVSMDQQITVMKPSSNVASVATPYTCTIFRGKDTNYNMWFDKCQLSQLGQDLSFATRSLTCSNKPSAIAMNAGIAGVYASGLGSISVDLNKQVLTDIYPMSIGPSADGKIFWLKSMYYDSFSIGLTAETIYATTNGWLNTSLGCFAYNNATNSYLKDYITFVQPGVDLELDPTVISCTRHHYVAPAGTIVPFYCVVFQPFYRGDVSISWEVWQASQAGGPYNTVIVNSQADVNARAWGKVLLVVDPVSSVANVSGSQQRQVGAGLNVTIDTASTINWRFRLLATYSGASISRSEFFSVATSDGSGFGGSGAKAGPQTGATKTGAAGVISPFVLLVSVAAVSLLLPIV